MSRVMLKFMLKYSRNPPLQTEIVWRALTVTRIDSNDLKR